MSTDQAGVLADLDAKMTELIGAPYTNLRSSIKDKVLTAIAYAVANFSGGTSSSTDALGTTGADVNVGAAAPPTTGQVLTATSATAATWQTPSGGGGVTDHAALTSLDYASAGHTGFFPADAGLTSLTSADAAAGLAYPDGANSWTRLALASADLGVYTSAPGVLATYDLTASGRSLGGITLAATSVVVGTGAGTAGVLPSTRGAVMVGGPSGWTALALGASGTVPQSNGTDLIMGTIGGSMLGSILTTQGDMLVRDASTVVRLPIGTQEGMTIRRINGLVAWGFVLAATVATQELSEIGTVGTTNSTRAGSIGQEGTIV